MSIDLRAFWKSGAVPQKLAEKYFETLERHNVLPEPIVYCDLQGALTLDTNPVSQNDLEEEAWPHKPNFQPNQPMVDLLNAFHQAGRKIIVLYHSNLRHVAEVRSGSENFIEKFQSRTWELHRRGVRNPRDMPKGPLAELLIQANENARDVYAENYLLTATQKEIATQESPLLPPATALALGIPNIEERVLKIA